MLGWWRPRPCTFLEAWGPAQAQSHLRSGSLIPLLTGFSAQMLWKPCHQDIPSSQDGPGHSLASNSHPSADPSWHRISKCRSMEVSPLQTYFRCGVKCLPNHLLDENLSGIWFQTHSGGSTGAGHRNTHLSWLVAAYTHRAGALKQNLLSASPQSGPRWDEGPAQGWTSVPTRRETKLWFQRTGASCCHKGSRDSAACP